MSLRNTALGWWSPGGPLPLFVDEKKLARAIFDPRLPVLVGYSGKTHVLVEDGTWHRPGRDVPDDALPLVAYVGPLAPQDLGDPAFRSAHGLRYAYVAGAMANGIGSADLVEAMGRAGMLGFFGAAGLGLDRIENAIDRLKSLKDVPFGFNLIHSPGEPALESATADLYLRRGIRLVSASAFLDLTLPLVRYRVHGIHQDADGNIVAPNRIVAKVSRLEVATKFFSPPPDDMLAELVGSGDITEQQARWAARIPMAEDLTAEADSGGHTDRQPALTLLPAMLALADRKNQSYRYPTPLRVGLAGGIATPSSVAAAFALGAAYVLTGSINQSCVEAGTSWEVRRMLAEAGPADMTMAPAADLFEIGGEVQVLKRGTLFAMRARKLLELYRSASSLENIPADRIEWMEKTLFRANISEVWKSTRDYFAERDPAQIERAESDARHRMALVFRWYLGLSSVWARTGDSARRVDYQVWCGPSMGAFNEWVRDSHLEPPENRRVVEVARNLLYGATVLTRTSCLASQGIRIRGHVAPLEAEKLKEYFS